MRLIEEVIKKDLDLYYEFSLRHKYKKALWKLFVAYDLALSVLEREDPKARKKNMLWKRFLLSSKGLESRYYQRMTKAMENDMRVIIDALKVIAEMKESSEFMFGDIYEEGAVAVLAYELPEEING